ncbi:MAG TPA: hypothetical protein PLW55_18685, partial [Leptospiraceae bacterium]|nr:hypothetical protein [Leptospiraceae bacterium]
EKDEFNLKTPLTRQAIPGDVAEVMASLMSEAAQYGGVSAGGYSGSVLGKTGTTNEHRDAWFVGVTPGVSAAVWVGFDNPGYSMYGATGAGVAGPLWGRIISRYDRNGGSFNFEPRAAHKRVCADSGLLPRKGCKNVIDEIFARGYVPDKQCDRHGDSPESSPSQPDRSINSNSDFQ